jgi:hypothetical protein
MEMSDSQRLISLATAELAERYAVAKASKARWTAEEKDVKVKLLLALGYDPDDPKPQPCEFIDANGEQVCEVTVGERRDLDRAYLRFTHPDVYAESERVLHPVSVKFPK